MQAEPGLIQAFAGMEYYISTKMDGSSHSVGIEEIDYDLPSKYPTVEALLERADGNYPKGGKKEGIVIRPTEPVYCELINAALSMKVVSNKYLLKNEWLKKSSSVVLSFPEIPDKADSDTPASNGQQKNWTRLFRKKIYGYYGKVCSER